MAGVKLAEQMDKEPDAFLKYAVSHSSHQSPRGGWSYRLWADGRVLDGSRPMATKVAWSRPGLAVESFPPRSCVRCMGSSPACAARRA